MHDSESVTFCNCYAFFHYTQMLPSICGRRFKRKNISRYEIRSCASLLARLQATMLASFNETNETQSLCNADTTRSWSAVWGLFRGPFNQAAVVCITQFTMRRCAAPIIPNCLCGLRRRAIKSLAPYRNASSGRIRVGTIMVA